MAKIAKKYVRGKFEAHDYEIHYSSKKGGFYAVNLLDAITSFATETVFSSESLLESAVRSWLFEYEKTLNDWTKYIVFYSDGRHVNETGITKSGWSGFRQRSVIALDFVIVWFTSDFKFYYTDEEKQRTTHPKPQHAGHTFRFHSGAQYKSEYKKILHTPELEAFFLSMAEQMKFLQARIDGVIGDEETILQLAASNTLLIGPPTE